MSVWTCSSKCPRWMFPLAYGNAAVTRMRRGAAPSFAGVSDMGAPMVPQPWKRGQVNDSLSPWQPNAPHLAPKPWISADGATSSICTWSRIFGPGSSGTTSPKDTRVNQPEAGCWDTGTYLGRPTPGSPAASGPSQPNHFGRARADAALFQEPRAPQGAVAKCPHTHADRPQRRRIPAGPSGWGARGVSRNTGGQRRRLAGSR